MPKKILIIDSREEGYDMEKQSFKKEGLKLVICECRGKTELLKHARDAYVIAFTYSKITEDIINQLPKCKMLIRYGIGLDNVDIPTASARGIYVCNTPHYGTFSVAEHAFSLLLSLSRKTIMLDSYVRANNWSFDGIPTIKTLKNKILGIVGFGNIGRYITQMAKGFHIKVIAYDPFTDKESMKEMGVEPVSFGELNERSDFISLHAPLTTGTYHLYNKSVFKTMKSDAVLINTSRGGLVCQQDLVTALETNQIGGAGLDVFEEEPLADDHELKRMENVILTPHVAWYTEESIVNLHQELVDEVLRVTDGKEPLNSVNKPSIK